ncbi:MAG: serine/threonine protein kinase [Candidatus Obscuribacterales bacterium]|nr:serine/threonine protein kinase [Candidatus Obscuribacterales bacterium]
MPDSQLCPKCKLRIIDPERLGSLTSFVLLDLSCHCNTLPSQKADLLRALTPRSNSKDSLCLKCNKLIVKVSEKGSLTNFLFQSNRCHCKNPQSAKDADRLLTARFQGNSNLEKRRHFRAARMTKIAGSRKRLPETIDEGQVVASTYQLLSKIGEGGMGSIYKAKHIALQRTCAVKFLNPDLLSRETFERFQEEARISASLNHPSICTIYDLGLHQGILPYYAMDFIKGANLEEVIHRHGPLSSGAVLELYADICEALAYAHRRGIIHKDLKPANFMLYHETSGKMGVKILDFGIAELSDRDKQEDGDIEKEISGSAAYMSPEQFRGEKLDKRTDIYSIGASIYETLTGTPPFDYYDYESLEEAHLNEEAKAMSERTGIEFPGALEAIVAKCLKKSPTDRYQNASELAIDLRRVLEGKAPQFAKPNYLTNRLTKIDYRDESTSSKQLKVLAAVAFLGIAVLFSLIQINVGKTSRETGSIKPSNMLERHITHSPLASEASKFMFGNPSGVEKLAEEFCKSKIEPYAKNISPNGSRTFVFPENFTLGDIEVLRASNGTVSRTLPANATIVVEEGAPIGYKPDELVFKFKELYSGFKSGDFTKLSIEGPFASEPGNLGFLAAVKGIQRLTFADCPEDKGEIAKGLSNFKDLKNLEFGTSKIDLRKLKGSDLPDSLSYFLYSPSCPIANYGPPAKAFSGKRIGSLNIPLKESDLEDLKAAVSIEVLTLRKPKLTPGFIENLSKLKGLRKIVINNLEYRDGIEELIERLPPLGGLYIEVFSPLDPSDVERLKAAMTKVAGKKAQLVLLSK